jgi:TonB-linked SusC/RagA family outer membrane protein
MKRPLRLRLRAAVLSLLLGLSWLGSVAQDRLISGKVIDSDGSPLPGASVQVKGTNRGTTTNSTGTYQLNAGPGATLVFSMIGMARQEVRVGNQSTINITLAAEAGELGEVVVTALGIKQEKRALGYSVSEVNGQEIAQTQRDNFVNGLQGRVAGVTVTGTSGMPGASSSIVIRGINSISGNNQPLFVIDGLPISNQTFGSSGANAPNLVADRNSGSSINNRTVDFQNRAGDLNPEDIESITILKGPEAAALYGVEAANGAVLITTKKGKAGQGRVTYSNNFTSELLGPVPSVQRVYGRGSNGVPNENSISYFGPRYPEGTEFFDNQNNFFQPGFAQRHNLSFDGGRENYSFRLSGGYLTRRGVVPTTQFDRFNLSLNGVAQITPKLRAEATLQYVNTKNVKVSRGQNSFLLGILQWPQTEDMSDYLLPDGRRRVLSTSTAEIENPYFDVNKNALQDDGNRFVNNVKLDYQALPWLTLTGQIGADIFAGQYSIKYHPESNRARAFGGALDQASENTRKLTIQYYATVQKQFGKFGSNVRLGSSVFDDRQVILATRGERFLVPDFNSINNTDPTTQRSLSNLIRRRLIGVWGSATFDYDRFLFLTVTARNDWSSTFPIQNRSFFYPSASLAFEFTRFLEGSGIQNVLNYGKLRASAAQVGKEAPPYSLFPALEAQTTTGGGFAYGFTAPNPFLRPEMVTSYELGTELKFFDNRLTLDAAYYRTKSVDQIINGLRISYGTGFILKTINGGELVNWGTEATLDAAIIRKPDFSWNLVTIFNSMGSRLLKLPASVTEFYDSDTWVYSNIRNGTRLNGPLTTFTGNSYQRNAAGEILINPTTGLPLTETLWNVVGDRNPRFTMGFNNQFRYKNLALSFLIDTRVGGDVFNATQRFLYVNGLSLRDIDRETPRIFQGVLNDGLQNSETPTRNTIQVIPYYNNGYYTSQADENFIERDINWVRLKDITLRYTIPTTVLSRTKVFKGASVFLTGTDLFLLTNYTGGDPGVNAVTPTKGGSGGGGIDFGNLPLMRTYNAGISISL